MLERYSVAFVSARGVLIIDEAFAVGDAGFSQKCEVLFKKLQATLHLTHYLVHPTIVLMTLLVLPLLIWGHGTFKPFVIIPLLSLMVISMVAPSSLYLFSQKVAYREWASRLKFIPGLMILGMGLAVNNTLGVLGAVFRRGGREFVRTPKLGEFAEGARAQPKRGTTPGYLIPLNKLVLLEAFMGLWAAAAFAKYLSMFKFLVGPILLLHALGFLYVGVTSVIHDKRDKRFQA